MSVRAEPKLTTLRDSLVGQVLVGTGQAQYHLRECIGEGGQGWVFRAHWSDPRGMTVIVKVLRPDTVSAESLRRFQQEAEVLRMLSAQPNPHIVRFYDHATAQIPSPFGGEPYRIPFTVLEFINGPTLEQVLKSRSKVGLPVKQVRRILRHVSLGLEVVHQQKVVHRDLKPSNILLAVDGGQEVAKVTDFGLVKLVELNLVRTATLAGASLGYAPPEQYERGNQRISPRTDVFSLAAVTYEMLAGRPAFPFSEGENPLLIVSRILNSPRPSLVRAQTVLSSELLRRPDLLASVDHALTRGLSADPAHRHESIRAFADEIDAALAPLEDSEQAVVAPVSPFESTALGESPSSPPAREPGSSPVSAPRSSSRVPESTLAQPTAWRFALVSRSLRPGTVRAVAFARRGELAIGVGSQGVARWERGQWTPMAIPSSLDPRLLRGVAWIDDGESVLVYGEASTVALLSLRGGTTLLQVDEPDVTFLGGTVDERGAVMLVGAHPFDGSFTRTLVGTTAGVVARVGPAGKLEIFAEAAATTRLNGAARVSPRIVLACGDRGALVKIEDDKAELVANLCRGDLAAIAALADGSALTVGAGGHALHVSQRLESSLEAVQTTRDLLALAVAPDGAAWAGAAQARLLRRSGGSWIRMSGELPTQAKVLTVHAGEGRVRAVSDDGAIIEGRLG